MLSIIELTFFEGKTDNDQSHMHTRIYVLYVYAQTHAPQNAHIQRREVRWSSRKENGAGRGSPSVMWACWCLIQRVGEGLSDGATCESRPEELRERAWGHLKEAGSWRTPASPQTWSRGQAWHVQRRCMEDGEARATPRSAAGGWPRGA